MIPSLAGVAIDWCGQIATTGPKRVSKEALAPGPPPATVPGLYQNDRDGQEGDLRIKNE